MEKESQHHMAFLTYRRAGCACGYVMEAVSRKDAAQKLMQHVLHPSAANKIADGPGEHKDCIIEDWSDRWGVCRDHLVYIDLDAERPYDAVQTELAI